MKTAVLIIITTFFSHPDKQPKLETIGTFYGEDYLSAAVACRVWGERQLHILPWEKKAGVLSRGFFCQMHDLQEAAQ